MKKIITFNSILFLVILITSVYYISAYNDISKNIIRLHVISNSNSREDIKIKEQVRDEILECVRKKISVDSSKQDVLNSLPDFENRANEFLKEKNINYRAKLFLGMSDIPKKEYNGITFPEGEYPAIRVVLGEGKGENWWCVAYPPLCFTEDVCGKLSDNGNEILKSSVGVNGYRIITSDIKYEFKIVEILKDLFRF